MSLSLIASPAGAAFGIRNDLETERFIQLIDELNGMASEFSLADMCPSIKLLQMMSTLRFKVEKLHKQIDEILVNIVNEHKGKIKEAKQEGAEGKEDLVDVLLNIQKRGDFKPQLADTSNIEVILVRTTKLTNLSSFAPQRKFCSSF